MIPSDLEVRLQAYGQVTVRGQGRVWRVSPVLGGGVWKVSGYHGRCPVVDRCFPNRRDAWQALLLSVLSEMGEDVWHAVKDRVLEQTLDRMTGGSD